MSKHEHGKMDVSVQEATFLGFLRMSKYVAIFSICVLIFAAIVNG